MISLPVERLSPVRPNVPEAGPLQRLEAHHLPPGEVEALYVHIPFCFHKCHYCDFYSITRQTPQRMERFVDLLLSEAESWRGVSATNGSGSVLRPRTVFFGGGTPTLLPIDAMARLLDGLRRRFDFSALCEWTVEANPATVTADYCRMLRAAGVDRLSFGAQSFEKAELAILERHHEAGDVARSVELSRAAGFRRLNVDLIYAIPGQTPDSWIASLDTALALQTGHVSAYNLTYESNTPMAVKKRLGHFQALDEDTELAMFHVARQRTSEAGMAAYEISNYAAPGQECRHNLNYWNGGSYVGLGPSAASHVRGVRWRNRPHLGEWETAVAAGQLPATDVEVLSPLRRAGELAMLQLRLADGIEYADFIARTGLDARAIYKEQLRTYGNVELLNVDSRGFRLTDKGLNVADALAAEFLAPSETA